MNTEQAKGIAGLLKSMLGPEQLEELKQRKVKIPFRAGMKLGGVKKR
ncbi:MAG: hypothetical protein WC307_05070 [Candidatus Nanoarchaeia archaeon]|jgi:hypothetical protein